MGGTSTVFESGHDVYFFRQDIRDSHPDGMFRLVLCRNLVFTYFEESLQTEALERIIRRIGPGGYLVVGAYESIPGGFPVLAPHEGAPGVYRLTHAPG
ncbi:MAG: CheR family methyltransferase [bacterium]